MNPAPIKPLISTSDLDKIDEIPPSISSIMSSFGESWMAKLLRQPTQPCYPHSSAAKRRARGDCCEFEARHLPKGSFPYCSNRPEQCFQVPFLRTRKIEPPAI